MTITLCVVSFALGLAINNLFSGKPDRDEYERGWKDGRLEGHMALMRYQDESNPKTSEPN